jgi:hypothetical protein
MGEMGCRADVMLLLLSDALTARCAAAVPCDLTSPISPCPVSRTSTSKQAEQTKPNKPPPSNGPPRRTRP